MGRQRNEHQPAEIIPLLRGPWDTCCPPTPAEISITSNGLQKHLKDREETPVSLFLGSTGDRGRREKNHGERLGKNKIGKEVHIVTEEGNWNVKRQRQPAF